MMLLNKEAADDRFCCDADSTNPDASLDLRRFSRAVSAVALSLSAPDATRLLD